ncbi:MAG: lytic transglycosylase domain-containing protein [Rhizobiaceae bacterium]|nr:lytic transglycosylase domain-containing protein [Rhizobiaceae bacterium]
MNRPTSMALAVALSLALTQGSFAEIASSTSTAPLKAGASLEKGTLEKGGGHGDRPFAAIIARHAAAEGVPLALAHAIIGVESNYRVKVTGRAGEVGLMQIKPATARGLGYTGSTKALYDPETNIRWGMKYLAGARDLGGGTTCGTVLKYNAGHYARRMNPVSKAYCRKVMKRLGEA